MEVASERRLLQAAVAICGLVPVGAGLAGIIAGIGFSDGAGGVSSDSHFRYLSGLLLGIGLAFWSTIPQIERRTPLFRWLTAIVVIGGLARLWALMTMGMPGGSMLFGLAMELVVTPALCIWQGRVSSRSTLSA